MRYDIVDAQPQDHASVDALAAQAWQVLRGGYDPAQWPRLIKAVGAMSRLSEKGQLILAKNEDDVCGAVVYMPPNASDPEIIPEGWPSIRMLATRPAYRNLGIGRRLTEECILRARRDGATCIGLHTSPVMTVALPLYLRMGFVKDKDLEPIAGAPYARYILDLDKRS